jgi:hypothetical protein
MSYLQQLQNRVTQIDSRISAIDANLAILTAETGPGSTGIAECLQMQIDRFNAIKNTLNNRKTAINNQISMLGDEWDGSEQTHVDAISTLFSGTYDSLLENNLKSSTQARRDEFFSNYAMAMNDVQREWYIKGFFNVN